MKNIQGIALFWAIAALAGMVSIDMIISITGQMPIISKDGYISRFFPVQEKLFWFITIPLITFSVRYFTELVKNNYEIIVQNIWRYIKFGTFIGTMSLIINYNNFGANNLQALLVFELVLMIFCPFFTNDHLDAVVIACISNIVLVFYYFISVTSYKVDMLILLPGIAITLLFMNMISFSIWPFILSIIERIISKEFWKSTKIGLQQALRE